jgi:hypothetical protein
MSESFSEKNDSRKLAHAYVALALAKDVANGYVREQPAHAVLHPLLSMLDVTARLLEEVLENALPKEDQGEALPEDSRSEDLRSEDLRSEDMSLPCSDMLM